MQSTLLNPDLSNKRVMIGLSGGINSMAVLCYLATQYYPESYKPSQLYIFYSHLTEHSPDTFKFVKAGIRYAQEKFECVTYKIIRHSVLKFFEGEKIIPHPIISPCSDRLKIIPMREFMKEHSIDIDLIGFVRSERHRITRQVKRGLNNKQYPIAHISNEDCFNLVESEIGWYPTIYDIRENGKRVFKHNNCLPCKNMIGDLNATCATGEYLDVSRYYPEHFRKAQELSEKLGSYWGRDKDFDGHCTICEF